MSISKIIEIVNQLWQNSFLRLGFYILKFILIIVSLFLLGEIIYFLAKTGFLKAYFLEDLTEFLSFKPYGGGKTEKEWKKIRNRLSLGKEEDFKVAVIEANILLDNLLKERKCEGIDTKEKLEKLGRDTVSNFNDFLEVYEVYKCVTEDPSYHLSKRDAERFLEVYEEVMKDLGFLS